MLLDRLIAALAACEVKAFVIPTPLNLWRKQPITEAAPLGPMMAMRILRDIA